MPRPPRSWFVWSLIVLSAVWLGAQLSLAWNDAPIVDEPIHFFDGALAVDLGDPTANPEHPPLLKMLAAAAARPWRTRVTPVAAGEDPRAPAPPFLILPARSARTRLFAARLPPIAIALAAIVVAGIWGRSIGAEAGGLGAAALLASSTLYGAHAHFVATDIAVSALVFCGAFFLDAAAGSLRGKRIFVAGLFLGGALAAKYSAVFLVPALLLLSAAARPSRQRMMALLGVAVATLLVLAAVTSFASRHATAAEVRAEIDRTRRGMTSNHLDVAGMAPLLALGDRLAGVSPGIGRYCLGTALVGSPALRRGAYPAFFHGRITTTGAIGYFPACVAFKFGTIAILAALVGAVSGRRRIPAFVVLLPLFYFAVALRAHYLLGARYLLPIYPFLCVCASALGVRPRLLAACAILSVAGAVSAYPYWLADSSLVGRAIGPIEEWFADSNLDWGQDLTRIERRARVRGIPVNIVGGSEFGLLPELYPRLRFPEARLPLPPGLYSVTRWKPFLRAAATPEGLAAFPPELRPLILKLRRDYEVLYRGPILRDLATPSMFGTAALAAP